MKRLILDPTIFTALCGYKNDCGENSQSEEKIMQGSVSHQVNATTEVIANKLAIVK
jgi:hypothetical protein